MSFVEFEDVRKIYRTGEVEVRALDGMDFSIERGELAVIVGPSGAGKTTVLNLLGGMDSCTSGTIRLDGRLVSAMGERELTRYRRHDVGFVFQFYNLVQNLTALENVELASQICRDPLPAADVLAQVGLAERADNFPAQLSGGEQQRVAIARALVLNPKILLLDEPLSALDWERRQEIMPWISRIRDEQHLPMLYVTHSADEMARLADNVVLMERGRIKAQGSAQDILSRFKTQAEVGEARESILEGQTAERDEKYGLVRVALSDSDASLWIPDSGLSLGSRIRIGLFERDISLALTPHTDTSIQNVIPVVVKSVDRKPGDAQVGVLLSVGSQQLVARITARSCDHLGIAPGCRLWAQIKSVVIKS